jgi:hypothetical protein
VFGITSMVPARKPVTEKDLMHLLLDDERCRIVHEAGDNGMAVVSFAGTGYALGGMQVEEFRKSLDGSSLDIYYVIDKQRRWYNGTYAAVVSTLNQSLRQRRVETTFTLGNSMGGFGAVVFAGALHRCVRAVAFSPQSSVCRSIAPFEDRWREWTETISEWQVPDAVPQMTSEISYVLFIGSVDERDRRHAARLVEAQGQTLLCVLDGCAHGVAAEIKRWGALVPLLGALLTPAAIDRRRLASLLGPIPHAIFARAE